MSLLANLRPGGQARRGVHRDPRPDRLPRRRPEPARPDRPPRPARAAQAGRAGGLHGHPQRVQHDHDGRPDLLPRRARRGKAGVRPPATKASGQFDLTPTEDEQMLVDVVTEFADEVVRPAAADADEACAAPEELLEASLEIGLPILGLPGVARRRLRGALGDGRHPGRRGAGQGRHGSGRRGAGARARSRPRSACGGPTSSSRPTCRRSPATTCRPRRWRSPSRRCSSTCSAPATTAVRDGRRLRAQRREVAGRRAAPTPSSSSSAPSSTASRCCSSSSPRPRA